jgi:hypothetical protein
MRAPLMALSPTPPAPKITTVVPRAHLSGVQDGASTGDNAAAEQRRLGERHILRQKGELIFMDKRAFGKAAEPQALKQANAMAA